MARGLERSAQSNDPIELLSSSPAPEPVPQTSIRPNTFHTIEESISAQERRTKTSAIDPRDSIALESPPRAIQSNKSRAAKQDALPEFSPIVFPAGTFTVKLVLDCREVRAKSDREYIQDELGGQGAKPLLRSLELGDAMWIAQVHNAEILKRHGEDGNEVVLDWIVERKRLDDLVGSIKDGRFREQKVWRNSGGYKF